ncbi:hypothetical protein SDRG_11267 [Saprolegnia diclina VS20]|uniref:Uncharacterized protein n=1 Tax=Saprolegnia diclina (strain VS20) TaxID=1156394 RepID=T0RM84_SAPDV|nr:hypothetical protein SDRG_11267 [Saprolegnia diclina VS20]EQC31082.1 hypothetical protein SDRG_11267 [Saprolegnia diclina VS20]|eukprot:XP_008615521.1 hypothetical protein SDRG_11267 [Saprolegnia diclina VS20]
MMLRQGRLGLDVLGCGHAPPWYRQHRSDGRSLVTVTLPRPVARHFEMSRGWALVILSLILSAAAMSPKVAPALATAFETTDRVNIMVELDGSTESVENRSSSGDNTNYMHDLQAFTAARQQAVKDVLAAHPTEFSGEPKFFWITNKVSVPQASAVLVMELADLSSVVAITGQHIVHIQPISIEREGF